MVITVPIPVAVSVDLHLFYTVTIPEMGFAFCKLVGQFSKPVCRIDKSLSSLANIRLEIH